MSKTWNYQASGLFLVTSTGNIDNLDFEKCGVIQMHNASLATLRGLKAGWDGQRVKIASTNAGQVNLANNDAGSSSGNRLINPVASGVMPLAPGTGWVEYTYFTSAGFWVQTGYQQGAAIAIPFSAGNFTASGAMTWTVASGNIAVYSYQFQSNRSLLLKWALDGTTVGGVASTDLNVALPNGYVSNGVAFGHLFFINAGVLGVGLVQVNGAGAVARNLLPTLGNWTVPAAANTSAYGFVLIDVP